MPVTAGKHPSSATAESVYKPILAASKEERGKKCGIFIRKKCVVDYLIKIPDC